MRGATETRSSSKMFLAVKGGKLVQRVEEGTDGAIARILGDKSPNKGMTIWEKDYESVTGAFKDIRIKEHSEYGKSFEFVLDTSEDYEHETIVSIGYASGYSADLLKHLPNINEKFDVTIRPYDFEGKDQETGRPKRFRGISVRQGDIKVAKFYTKETPNGIPPMEKITFKGKDEWDSSKMVAFLIENSLNPFVEKLRENESSPTETVENDDLPF